MVDATPSLEAEPTRRHQTLRALAKLGDHIRNGRVDQLARIFFDHVPPALLHFDVLYIAELSEPVRPARHADGVLIRQIHKDTVPELYRSFPRQDRSEFGERFEAGHKCFVSESDGTICGMAWLDMNAIHEEPEKFCRFVVPPDAGWHFDIMILPEWRRRGLFSLLMHHALDYIRREGRTRMCGFTSWHNKGSLKAHTNVGFRLTHRITAMNLFGFRFHTIRRLDEDRASRVSTGLLTTPTIDLSSATFESAP